MPHFFSLTNVQTFSECQQPGSILAGCTLHNTRPCPIIDVGWIFSLGASILWSALGSVTSSIDIMPSGEGLSYTEISKEGLAFSDILPSPG